MPTHYPKETVFRCFVSFLEYVSAEEISRSGDGEPGADTIRRWAKEGECTAGYPWDKIREMTASRRAMIAYEREVGERALRPWQEKVPEMAQDLIDTRDKIMDAIHAGTTKQFSAKDLIDVIKAEALIHGEATQRTETMSRYVQILAQLVARRVREGLQDPQLAERILDLIAQDFEAVRAAGGDMDAVKEIAPS